MKRLKSFWRTLTTKTALLEAENKRLRETNFALEDENEQLRKELRGAVNTMLSQAGVTPLPPAEETKVSTPRIRRLTLHQRQRMYAAATTPKENDDGRSRGRTEPVQ